MEEFYRIGKTYMDRKQITRGHTGHGKLSYQIGAEYGINHATVERAEKFTIGIDTIRSIDSELAESILKGQTEYTKKEIVAIGQAKPADRAQIAEQLLSGADILRRKEKPEPVLTVDRKKFEIQEAVAGLYADTFRTGGAEQLTRCIRMNAEPFIGMLRRILEQNKKDCESHRYAVIREINESLILKLREIEEEIEEC